MNECNECARAGENSVRIAIDQPLNVRGQVTEWNTCFLLPMAISAGALSRVLTTPFRGTSPNGGGCFL